jgi:cytoskeletal protein CcmA (bactofilin family)
MTINGEKATPCCISKGTRISGKLNFKELAQIEGEADGEITGDEIEIAQSAVVTARITANRLRVAGQVTGEIVAHERLELLPTARLQCTITTPTLVVIEGAYLDGDCRIPSRRATSPQSELQGTPPSDSYLPQLARPAVLSDDAPNGSLPAKILSKSGTADDG